MGHLRTVLNLSIADMALLLSLPKERMKRILKSRAKPSVTLLARVRQALPYCNPDWLLTGEGPVLLTTQQPVATPLHHPLPITPTNATGNTITHNNGTANQNYTVLNCQQGTVVCRLHLEMLMQTIQDKDEIIQLLKQQLAIE